MMTYRPAAIVLGAFVLLGLLGCTSVPVMGDARLSQGYALLYQLMKQEANVDKVLAVRDVSKPTEKVIKDIAKASAATRDQLKRFAKADRRIVFDDEGLPEIESKTRDSIQTSTTKQLLLKDGFEFHLLLAQVKATQYAQHLAGTLSQADANPERSGFLLRIADAFRKLNEAVAARLAAR